MSKLAIKGNDSGTATFTIEAPATSTDRTLTLPDEAGTVLTSGTPLSSFPSGFANGITEADQYRITQDFSLANGAVLNNYWERVDSDGFEKIGTGVSESAGVFTLPSTGYWLIYLTWTGRRNNVATDWLGMILQYTADNSNWSTAIEVLAGNDVNHRASGSGVHLVKITDTSNQKFRFLMETAAGSGTEFFGGTDRTKTGATFIRLGDI